MKRKFCIFIPSVPRHFRRPDRKAGAGTFLRNTVLLIGALLPFFLSGCRTHDGEPAEFRRVFVWGSPSDDEVARKYAEAGATDIPVSGKNCDLAVKYGMTPYCGPFLPAGPCPQVMTEEETAYHKYINGFDLDRGIPAGEREKITTQRMIEKKFRWGGEPDNGEVNTMHGYEIPCFNSDKDYALSKQRIDSILADAPKAVKGIYFDGIGYNNHYGCYCEKCRNDYKKYLADNNLKDTQPNKDAFYRDLLVNYYNAMIDYVKSKRPDFKVVIHGWPVFQPDPLFLNRTKSDYCGQTVAWYFEWPPDKIAKYTDYVLNHAKDFHPNAEGIPFVGLNAEKGLSLAYKSPEQLEMELQTILAAGGRTLMICNGADMIEPGYYEVFKKYCGKKADRR